MKCSYNKRFHGQMFLFFIEICKVMFNCAILSTYIFAINYSGVKLNAHSKVLQFRVVYKMHSLLYLRDIVSSGDVMWKNLNVNTKHSIGILLASCFSHVKHFLLGQCSRNIW